jgi:hypothetical protein
MLVDESLNPFASEFDAALANLKELNSRPRRASLSSGDNLSQGTRVHPK